LQYSDLSCRLVQHLQFLQCSDYTILKKPQQNSTFRESQPPIFLPQSLLKTIFWFLTLDIFFIGTISESTASVAAVMMTTTTYYSSNSEILDTILVKKNDDEGRRQTNEQWITPGLRLNDDVSIMMIWW
jgi:hypothetical protein